MKLITICYLAMAALTFAGTAHADEAMGFWGHMKKPKKSRWYCVSDSPVNMQSAGYTGYGHGRTQEEAARKAVQDCRDRGGFQCATPDCFPE